MRALLMLPLILAAGALPLAGAAMARSVYMTPSTTVGPPPPPPDRVRHIPQAIWETAFHIDHQEMFGEAARPMEARWLRRFDFGLGIGPGLGGIFESIVDRYHNPELDQTYRRARNAIWAGLVIDQVLWGNFERAPYVAFELGAGYGQVYQRRHPPQRAVESKNADFTYIEPALYGTVVTFAHLDFGARIAYRSVRLNVEDVGTSRDMSGLALGLVVRRRLL